MLDENLTWKNLINEIENKASKGIGLLYKTFFTQPKMSKRYLLRFHT